MRIPEAASEGGSEEEMGVKPQGGVERRPTRLHCSCSALSAWVFENTTPRASPVPPALQYCRRRMLARHCPLSPSPLRSGRGPSTHHGSIEYRMCPAGALRSFQHKSMCGHPSSRSLLVGTRPSPAGCFAVGTEDRDSRCPPLSISPLPYPLCVHVGTGFSVGGTTEVHDEPELRQPEPLGRRWWGSQ